MKLPVFNPVKRLVNLLPKDVFESSLIGRAMVWALSFGKWLVIVTQIVVIGVFLVRFGYDRQLTDLNKKIAQESAIIKSYSQIEEQYVLTQKRVNVIGPITNKNEKIIKIIDKFHSITPRDVWMERLTITPESAAVVANAASLSGFSQFVRNLSKDSEMKSVSIGNIQDGAQSGARLQFDLAIMMGGKK